jgi:hypothetical protein
VTDTIKTGGYLHEGMIGLLKSLKVDSKRKQNVLETVNSFFNDISLCGPRIFDAPDNKDNRKLCQLFVPYHHTMKRFYSLIEVLFRKPLRTQGATLAKISSVSKLDILPNSFIETTSKIGVKAENCDCKGTMMASGTKEAGDDCGKHGYGYNWCYTVNNKCGPSGNTNWKKCTPVITIAENVEKPSEPSGPNCACKGTNGGINVGDDCAKHGYNYNWCYTVDAKCGPGDNTNWKKCQLDGTAAEVVQDTEKENTAQETQSGVVNTGLSKDDVKSMIAEATSGLQSELKSNKKKIVSLESKSAALESKSATQIDEIASLKNKLKSNLAHQQRELNVKVLSLENQIKTKSANLVDEINTELKDAVTDTNIKEQLMKRQQNRLGKGGGTSIKSIGSIMRSKPKTNSKNATCTGGTPWTSEKLPGKKQLFCKGYKHLDLSSPEIKNIAIHYLNSDLSETMLNDTKHMSALATALRYDVQDTSCPSKLFDAKDISIQHVYMDTLGNEKEWVAVVNLNTQDTNGYLQSELPYCKARDYLIGAKAQVKAYIDDDGCCDGLKDYNQCVGKVTCENKLVKLNDKNHKHYSKDVVLTGTQYEVKSSYDVNRRRRLLQQHASGC